MDSRDIETNQADEAIQEDTTIDGSLEDVEEALLVKQTEELVDSDEADNEAALQSRYMVDPADNEELSPPQNHGSLPLFKTLVDELYDPIEEITQTDNRVNITRRKSDVFERYARHYRNDVGNDVLMVARLTLASQDKSRGFELKENRLGRMVLRMLGLTKTNEDYLKIMNWKAILGKGNYQNSYKFADLLAKVIEDRRTTDPDEKYALRVDQVDQILSDLKECGNKEEQNKLLENTINVMNKHELKFFFRIVLKRSPVGSETLFMKAWNNDIPVLYKATNSLKHCFYTLATSDAEIDDKEKRVRINFPFTPQRSEKVPNKYNEVAERFCKEWKTTSGERKSGFFIEEKFDGERVQVHITKDKDDNLCFKYYSRKSFDFTDVYGKGAGLRLGCLSPFLSKYNFIPEMRNCVLDGEMICYDPKLKKVLPFSTVRTAGAEFASRMVTQKGIMPENEPHPMFVCFDMLVCNNNPLDRQPLHNRKSLLEKVFVKECPFLFVKADYKVCTTGKQIEDHMIDAINRDWEGIMLKDPTSIYTPGSVSKAWVKIKPEYLTNFGENLDLLVVGRIPSNMKSAFICALRDTDKPTGNVDGLTELDCKFLTLCKVSNGFNRNLYNEIEKLSRGKWRNFKDDPPDPELIKFGKTVPIEWIHPEDSFVIEVRARSLTDQGFVEGYATDTTLINAYVTCMRHDKDWKTASTRFEYESFTNKGRQEDGADHSVIQKPKKRRLTAKQQTLKQLKDANGIVSFTEDSKNPDLFKDFIFNIQSECHFDGAFMCYSDLTRLLKSYGGSTVIKYDSIDPSNVKKLMIISEKKTSTVCSIAKSYNVFSFKWCEDCIRENKIVDLVKEHLFIAEDRLTEASKKNVDEFGTSYFITQYKDSFPFNEVKRRKLVHPIHSETEVHWSLFSDTERNLIKKDILIFKGSKFMIVSSGEDDWFVDLLRAKIEMLGGQVNFKLEEVTMILVIVKMDEIQRPDYKNLRIRLDELLIQRAETYRDSGKPVPKLIHYSFVDTCIKENRFVDIDGFGVRLPK